MSKVKPTVITTEAAITTAVTPVTTSWSESRSYEEIVKLLEGLNKQFVFMGDTIKLLGSSYYATMVEGVRQANILLYGPGGYGKTDIIKAMLKSLGVPDSEIFSRALNQETRAQDLFGPINMEKYMKGEYSISVENSIMAKQVVILEEGLDAPVISDGFYRDGTTVIPSRCKLIILLTNKAPEQFNSEPSAQALLGERFLYQAEVSWKSHDYEDYLAMFNAVFPLASKEKKEEVAQLEHPECSLSKLDGESDILNILKMEKLM